MKHVVPAVTTALFAVLVVMLAACSDGDGDPTRTPDGGSSTTISAPSATASAATSTTQSTATSVRASTRVIRFDPGTISTERSRAGNCWTQSLAAGRTGSYRCMDTQSQISDPCFGDGDRPSYVLCPGDPENASDDIILAATYDTFEPELTQRSSPWFLVTEDGDRCRAQTGTVRSTSIGYTPFECSGTTTDIACLPPADRGDGAWLIDCVDVATDREEKHSVAAIWF